MRRTHNLLLATTALALAVAALNPVAQANSPRSNSDYVEDVTLSMEGINLNMIELENKSGSKLVSKMDVQPVNSVMNVPLKGFVQCKKDKKVDFDKGTMYFGLAHRQGDNIVPVNALYQDSYHPTFKVWTGLLGGWIAEGGNAEPFEVPLANIKNGHPSVRVDPVEEFNKKLEAHVNGGGSELEFLKQDQFISVMRPVTLAGFCNKGAVSKGGYMTAMIPIGIKFKGDPDLVKSSPAQVSNNNLAAKFALTEAKVSPHIKDYIGQCPADLGFRLTFKAQGKGTVKYRMVNEVGAKGPVNTISFNNDGLKTIDFIRHIVAPSGGNINKLAINSPQQGGDIKGFQNTPSDKKHGSWTVEVLEPASSSSDESFYSWKCQPKPKFNTPTTLKQAPGKVQIDKIRAVPVDPKPQPKSLLKLQQSVPAN
ncbi:hypothetical protein [Kiloniella laminariae]|uniref:hypothetical protein n=1 Tax=Kiloniella laminariae TaxID=454162 RepID=UPI00037D620E|nr:hypothetical protein [Kiloniella laminariae]